MPKKVYIADLDALTVNFTKKIDDATRQTLEASAKMTNAFTRVSTAMEKDMKSSASSLSRFSKRDLGMLSTQLLATSGVAGKLSGQLSNLASGLLMGGGVGAAFAGFAAIINGLTTRSNEFSDALLAIRDSSTSVADKLRIFNTEMTKINEPDFWEGLRRQLTQFWGGFDGMIKDVIDRTTELKTALNESLGPAGTTGFLAGMQSNLESLRKQQQEAPTRERAMSFNEQILKIQNEINEVLGKQTNNLKEQEKIIKTIHREVGASVGPSGRASQGGIFGLPGSSKDTRGDSPIVKAGKALEDSIENSNNSMSALVSLSNQMASNFHFAGHTFVGQLSQAIAMVDSISNIILTIATLLGGGGGGFGIGGLLSLIGLEKGGRVTNRFGRLSLTNIPAFASGGSYSTPAFSGPFGGGYPVMVHKNETLDVYNSGQTSRLERIMMSVKDAIVTSNIHLSKRGRGGSGSTNVYIDGTKVFQVIQHNANKTARAGKSIEGVI